MVSRWLHRWCFVVVSIFWAGGALAEEMTLRQMLGQMILVGFRGKTVEDGSSIVRDIRQWHLGGVILFDRDVGTGGAARNIQTPQQLCALTTALQGYARIPLFIAVDQEGGRVRRLREEHGFAPLPSAEKMGQGSPEETRAWGERTGVALRQVGINLNFAPVVDVAVDPAGPAIGALGRSFASDPEAVARHALAFAQGLRAQGVIPCLKHFPGHGSARIDSHHEVTDISATWTPDELIPYRRILPTGIVPCVMVGHLVLRSTDPVVPATLSSALLQGLLRQELGFEGVIVSDDLQMRAIIDRYGLEEAAIQAIAAGVDVLVVGNMLDFDPEVVPRLVLALEQAVGSGRIPAARIAESWERIAAVKARFLGP